MMMGVIPMAFYAIVNLIAWLLETALHVAERLAPRLTSRLARNIRLRAGPRSSAPQAHAVKSAQAAKTT